LFFSKAKSIANILPPFQTPISTMSPRMFFWQTQSIAAILKSNLSLDKRENLEEMSAMLEITNNHNGRSI
jgi:hypothetical protein